MELNNLKPAKGATHNSKRIGRGTGSGKGGTSTRGHKGDKARSGFKNKRNFEGGQMPLQMRLPKVGFKNPNRVAYVPLNLGRLQAIAEKYNIHQLDLETLVAKGIVGNSDRVKILGTGTLKQKISVMAHACSASAKQTIEELGGSINLV
jgi:large subunit ribosomal protein L15